MKQAIVILALSLPFLLYAQMNSFNEGVKWTEGMSWGQIKEKAKQEKKFVFVDVFTTWCGPCKKMDNEVYPNKNVGEIINPKFISVKLQMDKTDNDNEKVKNWYPVVQQFNRQFNIVGYPSFLFFDPEGKLVHQASGWREVPAFIALVREALTDPEARYRKSIEKFRNGLLDYESMPNLARDAWKKMEFNLAREIAKDFIEKYLNNLSNEEAFTKMHLSFLSDFCYEILHTNDRYFQLFYTHPDLADSIINLDSNGRKQKKSKQIATTIIEKDEIDCKIYEGGRQDGKPITARKPDWHNIRETVLNQYGKEYFNILFPDAEIRFYESAKDWKNYMKYVNQKIKKYPPKRDGRLFGPFFGDKWHLNNYAWTLFRSCNNKRILKKAIPWSDIVINLEDRPVLKANYMDTKANLLYKMGKVKDAIELQEAAVELSKDDKLFNPSIKEVLEKMKAGLPTWKKSNN
jgi:thioredoxin-related protein